MKKSAAIGIAIAVIIAAVVAVYESSPKNSPTLPAQQNTPNQPQGNGTVPMVPVQNATGRHLSVTINEQVGIKSK